MLKLQELSCPSSPPTGYSLQTEDYSQLAETMDEVFKELNDLRDSGFEFKDVSWYKA